MSTQVEYIHMSKTEMTMEVNTYDVVFATAIPIDAPNRTLCYESDRPEIVSMNSNNGQVRANGIGTAKIKVYLESNPSIYAICTITVKGYISVDSISFPVPELAMDFDKTMSLGVIVKPSNATNPKVIWRSCCPDVASVSSVGIVTAHKPGIVDIYAITEDGNLTAKCEIWVRGKTPVFLIHGRTSNAFIAWGANNKITTNPLDTGESANNHFNSSLDALSEGTYRILYTNKYSQDLFGYNSGVTINVDDEKVNNFFIPAIFNGEFKNGEYKTSHPEGGNLAYYLKSNGYKENVNLFAFNYPNEDAVVHSALKFEAYINNLLTYVRKSGTDEMKTCFYSSRSAYQKEEHKINLVGHSMGGLISRYYIENLNYDKYVDKLITICTPHWGSKYADTACISGAAHKLCDHDLRTNSCMFGGENDEELNCNALGLNCYNGEYTLTKELKYSCDRCTKYYAIVGIDYTAFAINDNNYTFEMPTNFTTYQQISDFIYSKNLYTIDDNGQITKMNVKSTGDDMVGFMSQIGWTENIGTSPKKKINMEKIFIDVDTDGGNLEPIIRLHSKVQHRKKVMKCVYDYLNL